MGPTCEVLVENDGGIVLDDVDAVLVAAADQIVRTRKGCVWEVWVEGRPVQVSVGGLPTAVTLTAGCNGAEDYAVLRRLARELAASLGGVASEPLK